MNPLVHDPRPAHHWILLTLSSKETQNPSPSPHLHAPTLVLGHHHLSPRLPRMPLTWYPASTHDPVRAVLRMGGRVTLIRWKFDHVTPPTTPPMAPRVKASLYNDLQALIGHDLPAFSPYILPFFRFLESVFPKTAASSHPLAASPMTPTLKTLFITANTPVFQTPSIPITFCFFSRHSFCYIMKLFSYIDCFF